MINDIGIGGFMGEFRDEQCHLFMHWVQSELKRLKDSLPDGKDFGVVVVADNVLDIAYFAFSKLAYKLVCDSNGRFIPTSLLNELKALALHKGAGGSERRRRFKGNVWDAYSTKADWVVDVKQHAADAVADILMVIDEMDEVELHDISYSPRHVIVSEQLDGVIPKTTHDLIVINLLDFLNFYNSDSIAFNELHLVEHWQEHGWFEHEDWSLVLLAKIIVQVSESYRLYMRRFYRRQKDLVSFERYAAQDSGGFADVYKYLRLKLVEPRLALVATVLEVGK